MSAAEVSQTAAREEELLRRTDTFRASLSVGQRRQLLLPATFDNLTRWHTYPQWSLGARRRLGVDLATLDEQQWNALMHLLHMALNEGVGVGADAIREHILTDDYLQSIGMGAGYGRTGFRVAFLGEPSRTARWHFQLGGHHLAVTNTYDGGRLIAATPSFRAIEPGAPFTFLGRTHDPMGRKQRAFRALTRSLDIEQRRSADLGPRREDLLLGPGADWVFPTHRLGVSVSKLHPTQQALVFDVIETYIGDLPRADAATFAARYTEELPDTAVGTIGSPHLDRIGDAVIINGPSVWIELRMDEPYSTDQPHPHTIWRDRVTDYGGVRHGN